MQATFLCGTFLVLKLLFIFLLQYVTMGAFTLVWNILSFRIIEFFCYILLLWKLLLL